MKSCFTRNIESIHQNGDPIDLVDFKRIKNKTVEIPRAKL